MSNLSSVSTADGTSTNLDDVPLQKALELSLVDYHRPGAESTSTSFDRGMHRGYAKAAGLSRASNMGQ